MTNVNSSVIQNFLHFTITQVVPKIVADGYDNHVFLKLFSFELSHLHSSKLSFSIILPQNELIGNFATEPTKNRLAVESPTAFLLGGQPGSGKTSLRSAISEETQGNVVIIDNDTFKQQHPNFDELVKLYEKDVVKYVTPYSNRMTEAIISRLRDKGYNLVIEGTGRTTDVPIQTATMLQAKDYETKMYVMVVPKINSYLGTIERYETMYADDPMTARATPKQAHDIVVKNLPTNLETLHKTGLFSDIRLYNREGVKLYSSLETPSISPKETLERELNRKVSGKEIQPTLERIEQKMVQNQHQETPEFKAIQQKMESLQPPTPPIPKTPKLPGI